MSTGLTPWFPGDVKPARVGVYQTDGMTGDMECFQLWTGEGWGFCSFTAREADEARMYGLSGSQKPKWRGLAKKPATKDAEVSNG